jgi:hypothetical protein
MERTRLDALQAERRHEFGDVGALAQHVDDA